MGKFAKKSEINKGIKKMIEENALGLATINEKREPHNIAVGFVKVVSNNKLLITDNCLDETLKNIKYNQKVSLVVWRSDWKKNCIGYKLKGNAEYFTSLVTINKIKILD